VELRSRLGGAGQDRAAWVLLPILLLGVSGAFVYGIGFRPESKFVRIVLGPAAAWILIACGTGLLLLPRLP